MLDNRVRRITADGTISTVAGTGTSGFSGDGGPAANAQLNQPWGVAVDTSGSVYIVDSGNSRVRKVSGGQITTLAGNGFFNFAGDGGPAVSASLNWPTAAAVDGLGNLFIADMNNNRVRKVAPNGTISTVAGNGIAGYSGDSDSAAAAQLNNPRGVAVDTSGNLYISDANNNRIRKVATNGTISTVAGSGASSFSGDEGPATSAALNWPNEVAIDPLGNLYIADTNNQRIRKVTTFGSISTIAGSGAYDYSGDGSPAISAAFRQPWGLMVDSSGSVYVADSFNNAVRLLTVAGTAPVLTVNAHNKTALALGQNATYTLSVNNAASAGFTNGVVTLTETLPSGLMLLGISGSGWSCAANTCTRNDALGGGMSYPPITVTVNAATDAPVQVTNRVNVSGGGAAATGAQDLTEILATAAGSISAVVNGASFASGPAPGSVSTIFGSNLAAAAGNAAAVPLPMSLGGVSLTINGTAAPLWYVGQQQINFEMPTEVEPGTATAIVTIGGAATTPFSFVVAQAAPGIFTYGNNRAVATNPKGTLTDAGHPATPGSVITVYLTGLGPLDHPVPTNTPSPTRPLSRAILPASATIGGMKTPIQFLGLTPGSIALAQANITVPNLGKGDHPVVITIDGVASNAPLVAVGGQ